MAQEIDPQARLRRVHYRANHRGTKEMDILLGRFAETALNEMSAGETILFEQMLALPDPQIDSWIRGDDPPEIFAGLIHQIRAFHGF